VLVAEWLHAISQITLWKKADGISDKLWNRAVDRFHTAYSSFFVSQFQESDEQGNRHVTLEQINRLSRDRTGRLLEACLVAPAIADLTDLADPGCHYTRRVVHLAVRLVVEDGLPYRPASWHLWRDHRVFVPWATIQNWVEATGKKS